MHFHLSSQKRHQCKHYPRKILNQLLHKSFNEDSIVILQSNARIQNVLVNEYYAYLEFNEHNQGPEGPLVSKMRCNPKQKFVC